MRPESKPKLGATRAVPSSLSMSQTNRYSQLRGNSSNPFADDDETTEVNFRPPSTKSPLQQENSSPSRRSAPRRSLPLPPRPLPPPPPPKRPSNSGVEMTRVVRGSNPFDVEEGKDDNRDSTRSESSTADEPDDDEQPVPGSDGKPIMRTKEENKIIRFLVSKRVYKYPGCTDSWCSNYFSYISNNHPFFSMIFVHYLHPFGRRQRLMVFLNGIFFAIFISFVMFETTLVPRLATCREGCNKQPRIQSDGSHKGYYCEGGYNDGVDYETYDKVCYFYHPWELSAICGCFIVLYQSTLEFVATCSCIQGRAYCLCRSWQCNFFRRGVEFCGGGILFFFTSISTALLIWSLVACYLWGANFTLFSGIIVSKLWSFIEWFVWSLPYFMYRFPIDKRVYLEKMAKKYGLKTRDTGDERYARTRSLLKVTSDAMQIFM